MLFKAVSTNGVLVEKLFDEDAYKSPSELEQAIKQFTKRWAESGDPLVSWHREEN